MDLAHVPALAQYLKDLWLYRCEMAVGMTPNWGKSSISQRTGLASSTVLAGWRNDLTSLMKATISNAKSCTSFGETPCNCTGWRLAEEQLCRQRSGGPGGKAEHGSPECPCSEGVNTQSLNGSWPCFQQGVQTESLQKSLPNKIIPRLVNRAPLQLPLKDRKE